MMAKSHIISGKQIYSGRLLKLELLRVQGPDGRAREREVVRHPGAVAFIPLLEENGVQEVVLVRQYRAPLDKELLEIPAGTLELGESPLECAKRELAEETGYRARRWEKLIEYYSTPGFCDERLHIYLAQDLEPIKDNQAHPDDGEFLRIERVPVGQLRQMLQAGELEDAKTIIGLSLFFLSSSAGNGG